MRTIFLFLISFLLLYVDISFTNISPIDVAFLNVYFVPKLLFMFILLLSYYLGLKWSVTTALILGLMTDVYIGTIYGLHLFGFVLFVLFMNSAFRVFYRDYVTLFFVVIMNTFLFDTYIYLIYRVIGVIEMPVFDYFALRAVPSLLLNSILYIPLLIVVIILSKIRKSVFNNR